MRSSGDVPKCRTLLIRAERSVSERLSAMAQSLTGTGGLHLIVYKIFGAFLVRLTFASPYLTETVQMDVWGICYANRQGHEPSGNAEDTAGGAVSGTAGVAASSVAGPTMFRPRLPLATGDERSTIRLML
jgi:hypothetical protein